MYTYSTPKAAGCIAMFFFIAMYPCNVSYLCHVSLKRQDTLQVEGNDRETYTERHQKKLCPEANWERASTKSLPIFFSQFFFEFSHFFLKKIVS